MDTELQGQIDARKAQAKERRIADKAVRVALHLGSGRVEWVGSHDIATDMVYDNTHCPHLRYAPLKIVYHSSRRFFGDGGEWTTVEVSLDGEVVFTKQGTLKRGATPKSAMWLLTGYIPGPWEEELDRLQPAASTASGKAVKAAAAAREKAEAEEAARTRKLWGLA